MSRMIRLILPSMAIVAFGSCNDSTGPGGGGGGPLPPGLTLALSPFVTSGLTAPVFLAQPLDDGRIFVVEQPGRIRLIKNGVLQTVRQVWDGGLRPRTRYLLTLVSPMSMPSLSNSP